MEDFDNGYARRGVANADSAVEFSLKSQLKRMADINERFYRAMQSLTTQTGHLPHKGKCTPECEEIMKCLELWKAP